MTGTANAKTTHALLTQDDPPAFEIVNSEGSASAVLVCDHASNRIPRRLGTLGLRSKQLADHIAWDLGAAEVSRSLSARLDAPLVLSGYSRLVIDCNRPLNSSESIAEQSAGVPIPGNRELMPHERQMRVDGLFRPYHRAIDQLLNGRTGRPSLLFSLHSFTPMLDGQQRPWPIAVSYGRDRRLAALLLRALARCGDLHVGENEPYPVEDAYDYTIPIHGEGRGIPHVMIEIRQDGIQTPADAAAWGARLAEIYRLVETDALALVASH